jgi:hypothetical protein
MKTTFYGPGGYDPDLPDDNIIRIEETPDDAPAPTDDVVNVLLEAVKALAANKRADATSILSALSLDPTE